MRSIGVFGGAFDPPHIAHVAVVRAALAQLELDRLHVFPTARPWHRAEAATAFGHRLQMARLAFAEIDRVWVDDAESLRDGPSYSVDTVAALRQSHAGAKLFLIVGGDQADAIQRWRQWRELLRMATLCVVARSAPAAMSAPQASGAAAPPRIQAAQISAFRPQRVDLHMPAMNVSATEIRRRIASGEDWASLVPSGVARYIADHQLYRST